MKKLGKEVKFLSTREGHPRNGEGSLIRLKNGDVLYVFTEYMGSERADDSCARLSACISTDGGESFSDPQPMLEKGEGVVNIMSASLIRLGNGELGLIYLQKVAAPDGGESCMPYFVSSADEGKSWSAPTLCTSEESYYVVVNDSATVLKGGRILVPMADCKGLYYPGLGFKNRCGSVIRFVYSDDCGKSWHYLPSEIAPPYCDLTGLQEPGVFKYENGELWVYCRTSYGFQYQSFSSDGGLSWTKPEPNLFFTSPDAPMRVKRVGDYTVAIFNPIPHNYFLRSTEDWGAPKRTPLAIAVSRDGGRSFQLSFKHSVNGDLRSMAGLLALVEDDRVESYCYPSITEVDNGFLVAYYHSGGTGHCLTCNKITKIYYSEIENMEE